MIGFAACGDPKGGSDGAVGSEGGSATTSSGSGTGVDGIITGGSSEGGTTDDPDGLPFPPAGPDAVPDPSAMGPCPWAW